MKIEIATANLAKLQQFFNVDYKGAIGVLAFRFLGCNEHQSQHIFAGIWNDDDNGFYVTHFFIQERTEGIWTFEFSGSSFANGSLDDCLNVLSELSVS